MKHVHQLVKCLSFTFAVSTVILGGSPHVYGQDGVMMQYFHWYYPGGGVLWNEVADRAEELAAAG